jgi:amylosucrase
MGKRLGTTCMNQPEVHDIVQALHALTTLAAPAVAFKAEAIVAPDDLVGYLGGHDRYRPECELAYHNQLMVVLWSSIATKDARLATQSLRRLRPIPSETSWATYVRCHDDIGWAVSEQDARAVGYDPFATATSSTPSSPGSSPVLRPRRPVRRQPRDRRRPHLRLGRGPDRIVEARERGDAGALEAGVRRLVLLHAVAYAWGGVPLLYMGDELAQGGDDGYLADPARAHDNRWMHRPFFDEAAAARRHDPATVEGRVFGWLRALAEARADQPALHAAGGVGRARPGLAARAGLAPAPPPQRQLRRPGQLRRAPRHDRTRGCSTGWAGSTPCCPPTGPLRVHQDRLVLPGLGFVWLAEP